MYPHYLEEEMATTFQARTQTYLGAGYTETTGLAENLMAGARYIVDLLPESKLDKYAANLTDGGSGATVTGHRVFRAHKGGYRAPRIDAGLKTQVLTSGALSVVSIVSGGSGYALNDVLTLSQGTSGTCTVTGVSATVVTAVEITTAGSAFTQGVKTTTVAPAGGTNCTLFVIPSNSSIYEATTTDPVYYIENTKGYVIPGGGTLIGMAYPTIAYGDTSISNFPIEFEHGVVLYAVIQGCIDLINDSRATMVALSYATVTPPSAPADSSYSYTDATLGTYTSTTIGSLGTPPTYTKATISLTVAPSDMTISSSPPSTPSAPAYSYTDATLGVFSAVTIGSLGTAPTYTMPVSSFSSSSATTYIGTSEDLEKAQVEINKQNALISQFNHDISNELNKFNKESEVYRSTVQSAIKNAEFDQERLNLQANKVTDLNLQNEIQSLNASISLYKDTLQKYASDLDLYQSTVNKEVVLYKTNLEKWQTLRSTELQQFGLDIQNEFNEYSKELAIYQSTVQNAIRQAELDQERLMLSANKTTDLSIQNKAQTLNKDISLFKDKLQKFAEQIQLYASQVQDAQIKYSLDQQKYQAEINHFTLILNGAKKEFEDYLKGRI